MVTAEEFQRDGACETIDVRHPFDTFTNMKTFIHISCLTVSVAFTTTVFAEGDVEYGEYLSSECVTCHQAQDTEASIPVINGMDPEAMASILNLYRAEELENAAMRTVAKRLTDEDIAALAAYFASLPEPE